MLNMNMNDLVNIHEGNPTKCSVYPYRYMEDTI